MVKQTISDHWPKLLGFTLTLILILIGVIWASLTSDIEAKVDKEVYRLEITVMKEDIREIRTEQKEQTKLLQEIKVEMAKGGR